MDYAKPKVSVADRLKRLKERHEALKQIRNSWLSVWREIAEHMRPRGFREYRTDVNRGDKKHQKIINFTPLEAARTLAAGMMTGITSPARPWFRFTLSNPQLAELPEVRWWLSESERVVREALSRSNIYLSLHATYADLGPFCTGVVLVEDDVEDDVRGYNFPVGSYCLASSKRGKVDTLFREVSLPVEQVVGDFGEANCSEQVMRLHREGKLDDRIDISHAIYPNPDFVPGALGPRGKPFVSCWWETKCPNGHGKFLREGGYDELPFMAPRWEVVGEDVYGHGPGFAALGDCKALQLLERRGAQAVDKHINPPMSAPVMASARAISLLPGDVNFVDGMGAGQALRPAVQADPKAVEVVEIQKREYEKRIRKAFYADLWLMLSESDGRMTAREVIERREEKLQQLGTVLEALQEELLDPLVTRVYNVLQRKGKIPPPPEEVADMDFKVEFLSIAGQAQKVLGTTGLERLAAFAGNLAQVKGDVIDKVDFDQLVDEYSDALGVPPAVVRADKAVESLRSKRDAQMQQQQAAMQAESAAKTAKTLADADTENPNALTEMLRGMGQR